MKYLKKALMWSLFTTALTPAIYAESTLTPAQNAKTLFVRFFLAVTSLLFAILIIKERDFRNEISHRLKIIWKHPLVKVTAILYGILLISTIFAFHRYIAFLGEVERDEGFIGLTFFYGIFLYGLLLFKKKDWYTYFGLTMLTQIPIFFFTILQLAQGANRTNSILGNPIYFAAYALCLFAISIIMYFYAKKEKHPILKFFSLIAIIVAGIELFTGNTRAVLLGVVISLPIIFVYALVNSSALFPKIPKKKIRNIAIILISVFVVFSGIFLSTRRSAFWAHIPGFDRIATSNIDDSTTKSRLISWNIALHSINPLDKNVSIMRSLFGYGWDNYFFAWQKFYDLTIYEYDVATFDHPHNKLLDILVMNGILGFIAYLSFWFLFIRTLVRYAKKEPIISLVLIFWSVAYFVQNLFAFDTIITWIITFAMFAFIINETIEYEKSS